MGEFHPYKMETEVRFLMGVRVPSYAKARKPVPEVRSCQTDVGSIAWCSVAEWLMRPDGVMRGPVR